MVAAEIFILKVLHRLHITNDIQFNRRRDIIIISNSRLFNKDWYLKTYPDVKMTGINPVAHYLQYGWKEGKNPSADFNGNLYLEKYPDVANEGMCPLIHYERFGRNEERYGNYLKAELSDAGLKDNRYTVQNGLMVCKNKIAACQPKFSVIMPTYNRISCIDKAVDSILNQTYRNFELIIVDDGSTDGTQNFLESRYKKQLDDKKIRYYYKNHSGVCKTRNYALSEAKNEWIAYLDTDNCMMPDFLENYANAIICNRHKKVFYSKMIKICSGEPIGHEFNYNKLLVKNYIDMGVFVHHRSLYETLGGFDENMTRFVDWDLISTYCKARRPYFIDKITLFYNDSTDLNRISLTDNYYDNLSYYRKKHCPHLFRNNNEK